MSTKDQLLFDAIETGDRPTVETAVATDHQAGKNVGSMGVTAILHALYHDQEAIADVLADACADPLDLHEATALGRVEQVGEILARNETPLDARSGDGFTAVHYAAFFAHPACLHALLSAGAPADLPADNPSQVRPLHSALVRPDPEVVRQLLDAGVDVDAPQTGGYTALHSAHHRGATEIIDLLLAAGADPHVRSDDGRTPAEMAPSSPPDDAPVTE